MKKVLKFLKKTKCRIGFGSIGSVCLMMGMVFIILGLKPPENTKIVPVLKDVSEIQEKKVTNLGGQGKSNEEKEGNETTYNMFETRKKFDFDNGQNNESVSPTFDFNSLRNRKAKEAQVVVRDTGYVADQEPAKVFNTKPVDRKTVASQPVTRTRERGNVRTENRSVDLVKANPVKDERVETKRKKYVFNFGSKSEGSNYESSSFESEWVKIELDQDYKVKSGTVTSVSFRLNDQIVINGDVFEKGSTLIGQATFKKSRILVSIHTIKDLKNHNTASIVMDLYDIDKSQGILYDRSASKKGGKIVKDAVRDIAREVPFGGIIRGATNGIGSKSTTVLRKGSMYYLKN